MKRAQRRDATFLEDVAAAAGREDVLHVWWLGQSGFLIAYAGSYGLLDPYLSDSLTEKYRGTDTPHVRVTERVVGPEALDFVDLVTASHGHTDHLDGETLSAVMAASPDAVLVAPEAERGRAEDRARAGADRVLGMDDGTRAEVAGLGVEAVPAAHETLERDERNRLRQLGYVISCGPFRVYHSGDTIPYEGMSKRIGPVDLALLPINGRGGELPVAGNMTPAEAAALAAALPARVAVPCHYDMFEFNGGDPADFAAACRREGVECEVLPVGGRLSLRARAAGGR